MSTGKLPPDSPRYWYFVYMAALVVLALLLVPWPRLAAVVLSLAILEAAFGLGTAYLYKVGLLGQTVFPREEEAEYRFRWHPLLQGVPIPSGANADDMHHNALGQRGRERTPQSLERQGDDRPVRRLDDLRRRRQRRRDLGRSPARRCWAPTASPSSITACRATRRQST